MQQAPLSLTGWMVQAADARVGNPTLWKPTVLTTRRLRVEEICRRPPPWGELGPEPQWRRAGARLLPHLWAESWALSSAGSLPQRLLSRSSPQYPRPYAAAPRLESSARWARHNPEGVAVSVLRYRRLRGAGWGDGTRSLMSSSTS